MHTNAGVIGADTPSGGFQFRVFIVCVTSRQAGLLDRLLVVDVLYWIAKLCLIEEQCASHNMVSPAAQLLVRRREDESTKADDAVPGIPPSGNYKRYANIPSLPTLLASCPFAAVYGTGKPAMRTDTAHAKTSRAIN